MTIKLWVHVLAAARGVVAFAGASPTRPAPGKGKPARPNSCGGATTRGPVSAPRHPRRLAGVEFAIFHEAAPLVGGGARARGAAAARTCGGVSRAIYATLRGVVRRRFWGGAKGQNCAPSPAPGAAGLREAPPKATPPRAAASTWTHSLIVI